jgi:two-component system, OmpR family, sensor histidine kinase KdpD
MIGMKQIKYVTWNSGVMVMIMMLITLLSLFFRYIGITETNIIITFILGVLLVSKFTEGYLYGIISSIIGVLDFNFFFTVPYYSLAAYRPDYPVTFVIMLIAAIITSTSTTKVKKEASLSSFREKQTQILYQISKNLLQAPDVEQILEIGAKKIFESINHSVFITMLKSANGLSEPYILKTDENEQMFLNDDELRKTIQTNKSLETKNVIYFPIKGLDESLGVIGISCLNSTLTTEQKSFVEAISMQLALTMEREKISKKQQKAQVEMEREKLRGNLLRAVSHDLRTPLTGILGSTTTLLEHGETLERDMKRQLLVDIFEDSKWLIDSVENILSITRMDDGKVLIHKNIELVEEVVSEAVLRIKKTDIHHEIIITIPDEPIMIPMDGILIKQVLINLFDNAIIYTPHHSTIKVKVFLKDDFVYFEVMDNGNGIPDKNLPLIFDRFFTTSSRRGIGLGLAICKSIITAHGGVISAFNNENGGATFRFTLPVKDDTHGK